MSLSPFPFLDPLVGHSPAGPKDDARKVSPRWSDWLNALRVLVNTLRDEVTAFATSLTTTALTATTATIGTLAVSGAAVVSGALSAASVAATGALSAATAAIAGATSIGGLLTVSSGQIAFPATQNASTDAHTLDDYEEGTFTPTLHTVSGTDLSSVTYDTQIGTYIKIGRQVHVVVTLKTDAVTVGGATTGLCVSGLPFAAANDNQFTAATVGLAFSWAVNAPGKAWVTANESRIQLRRNDNADAIYPSDLNTGVDSNFVCLAVSYRAAA